MPANASNSFRPTTIGQSAYDLISDLIPARPASSIKFARVTTISPALESPESGSRRRPKGIVLRPPKGFVASMRTISRSRRARRCWNASSRTKTVGSKFAIANPAAATRSASAMITAFPSKARASSTGSSPPSRASARIAFPSQTTTRSRGFDRLYPLEIMQTRSPLSISNRATSATNGVLPVPPTVMLPTLIVGRPRSNDFNRPRSKRALRNSVTFE